MSRIDYFTASLDSISNSSSQPVNYIGFSLIDNIDGNMEMEMDNQGEKPFLNIKVNSNSETKWFMVLYLQKVYIKNSVDKNNTDMVKYSTSDNNTVYAIYTDNNIFIVGDASIRVFQELENNGLIVNNVIKPWDLYDEIGLKSLVKLALENFNNNILNCDPVYITEPIINKKKSKI